MSTELDPEKKRSNDEIERRLQEKDYTRLEDKDWLSLEEGEHVVYWEHPHWFKYISDITFSFVMVAFGAFLFVFQTTNEISYIPEYAFFWVGVVSIIFGFGVAGYQVLKRSRTYYIITDQRLIKRTNIFRIDPSSTYLANIQTADTYQSGRAYVSRLLADITGYERLEYGEIRLSTAGQSGDDKIITFVPDIYTFMTILSNNRQEKQDPDV